MRIGFQFSCLVAHVDLVGRPIWHLPQNRDVCVALRLILLRHLANAAGLSFRL